MYRIQGAVKQISFARGPGLSIYGIVTGDNGLDYFFIPSMMNPPKQSYYSLKIGSILEFDPLPTPTGLRADHVTVLYLSSADRSAARGEVYPER